MNNTNPTITRLIIALTHLPHIIAFSATAAVTTTSQSITAGKASDNVYFNSAKSIPPEKCPIMGIMMSPTNPETTRPIAPAKITAIARSSAFL